MVDPSRDRTVELSTLLETVQPPEDVPYHFAHAALDQTEALVFGYLRAAPTTPGWVANRLRLPNEPVLAAFRRLVFTGLVRIATPSREGYRTGRRQRR
jgi:hypothetical protein